MNTGGRNGKRQGGGSWFTRVAKATARASGRPSVFVGALALILVWALLGPAFGFSDTWQLVINTGTTIITFLMVFLIQNTQNRDAEAVQLKLDELIRAVEGARNRLIDLEDQGDEELEHLRAEYSNLAERVRTHDSLHGTDVPEVESQPRSKRR